MPRSSGVYSRVSGTPYIYDTDIDEVVVNSEMDDIGDALTQSIARDGQTTITANIPFNGNKITGLGAGTTRTDAASLATIQDGTGVYVSTVGGTADVIALTPSPAISSYAAGQLFAFIASGANTTNVTVNVSGLGAKAITKNGTTTLVAGDIPSGHLVNIRYDGTRFQLVGAKDAFNGGTVTNDIIVPDEAYAVGWNANLEVPTKNAVYDKIETLASKGAITSSGLTVATDKLLGRDTAGTGAIEELSIGTGLTLTAGTLSVSSTVNSIRVYSDNGAGSTNTAIRRFVTQDYATGSAITYADSATNGASFTINEDGIYSISFTDNFSTAAHMGISLNSAQLTTAVNSINAVDCLAQMFTTSGNGAGCVMVTVALVNGDVIRPHCGVSLTNGTATGETFIITKVG